jgi:hypothetical protein
MRNRGRPPIADILTPREWEVLELLRAGLTNRETARRLGISLGGAKFHVSENHPQAGSREPGGGGRLAPGRIATLGVGNDGLVPAGAASNDCLPANAEDGCGCRAGSPYADVPRVYRLDVDAKLHSREEPTRSGRVQRGAASLPAPGGDRLLAAGAHARSLSRLDGRAVPRIDVA